MQTADCWLGDFRLRGSINKQTRIVCSGDSTGYGWVVTSMSNVLFENLIFTGATHYGMAIISGNNIYVHNCEFHNSTRGLEIKNIKQRVEVIGCVFQNLTGSRDLATFFVVNSKEALVSNNEFRYVYCSEPNGAIASCID
jgi:hypothetical protein